MHSVADFPSTREAETAELRLLTTPAVYLDQWFQKFQAFEMVLVDELVTGMRRDSILLLAIGSLKQDLLNLDVIQ
jgi:hypothetical protein